MTQDRGDQRDQIIDHIKILNKHIKQQMSVWHVFRNGLIHGIGFIIGSTVLTAAVVSIVLHFFDDTVLADTIFWIARMGR